MEASRIAAVREALVALGFRLEEQPPDQEGPGPDFLARQGASSYALEVKVQSPFRRSQFLGAVAHGILALRAWQKRGSRLKPLLAVWVETARPNAASELESYLGENAGDFDWLIVDASGWRRWKIGHD